MPGEGLETGVWIVCVVGVEGAVLFTKAWLDIAVDGERFALDLLVRIDRSRQERILREDGEDLPPRTVTLSRLSNKRNTREHSPRSM